MQNTITVFQLQKTGPVPQSGSGAGSYFQNTIPGSRLQGSRSSVQGRVKLAPSRAAPKPAAPAKKARDNSTAMGVGKMGSIYVNKVVWEEDRLMVYQSIISRFSASPIDRTLAWREVIRLAPDADTGSMADQFYCHWDFVKYRAPRKPSWNLDFNSPDTSYIQTVRSQCNPQ